VTAPRLGIVLSPFASEPVADFIAVAREAETRGYHTAWLGESSGYDAISLMTLIASHTERIHVGSAVVPIQTRTPVVLGVSAASLGHVAPGRVALGLGLSSRTIVGDWHGLPFGTSLRQIREAVQIIRLTASGERVNFEGTFYRVKNFRMTAPPPEKPVRVVLAALGPEMLELAGEIGDGVVLNWIPPETVPASIKHLERGGRGERSTGSRSRRSSGPASPTTPRGRARRWRATSPGTRSWTPTRVSSAPPGSGTRWRESTPPGRRATGRAQ